MIDRIRKMFVKYTPWEKGIIEFLLFSLSDSAGFVISGQVKEFNRIQRILNDSEVDFYVVRNGIIDRSALLRLSDHSEFTIAVILTVVRGIAINTKVQMIDGYLFSLESDYPIGDICFETGFQYENKYLDARYGKSAQQVDSAEAATHD